MGGIYYLMGKSSSGKDTVYRRLAAEKKLDPLILYTTRPIRDGEADGREYHFVSEEEYALIKQSGSIIEERVYNTVCGPWRYFTVDDGCLDIKNKSYIVIGTLESYIRVSDYFGKDHVIPIYIETDDGERLMRALMREQKEKEPKYAEMCRRFLADAEDFSDNKICEAGITRRFKNDDLEHCIAEIEEYIDMSLIGGAYGYKS